MAIVRVPTDYPTIQQAIDGAAPTDMIIIESGYVFPESASVMVENLTFDGQTAATGIQLTLAAGISDATLSGTTGIAVVGNDLGNTITGNAGNNNINAGDGGDILDGGDNDDAVFGEDGNDTLHWTAGIDTLDGGNGDDFFDLNNVTVVGNSIQGGDGDLDAVEFRSGVLVNAFDATTSSIRYLFADGNTINGTAGNDIIDMQGAASFSGQALTIKGNGGDDVLTATGLQIMHLDGGAGQDTLTGGSATLNGGDDDDTLIGGGGNTTFIGGPGIDLVSFAAGTSVTVDLSIVGQQDLGGGHGFDSLSGIENVEGSPDDDTLTGDDAANRLEGGNGNDVMEGDSGNDTLVGGGGDDVMQGGKGNDTLVGGVGDGDMAVLTGPSAEYTMVLPLNPDGTVQLQPDGTFTITIIDNQADRDGEDSATGVEALAFEDGWFAANPGGSAAFHLDMDDLVTPRPPLIQGGTGTADTAYVRWSDEAIRVGMDLLRMEEQERRDIYEVSFSAPLFGAALILFSDVEVITIEAFNAEKFEIDLSPPPPSQQPLHVNSGAQAAAGAASNSQVVLIAGDGNNLMDASKTTGSRGVVMNAAGGADTLLGGGGADILNAGAGGDFLDGGTNDDTLNGELGADEMHGGLGNDVLDGGDGNDTSFGGAGNDTLNGGDGNDTLVGNADIFASEQDTLSGGAGDDDIRAEVSDVIQGGPGRDVVQVVNANPFVIDMGATSIEFIISDFGNDTIDASTQTVGVEVFTDGGEDVITGSGFDDLIFAGSGNDTVTGGDGSDSIVADVGTDNVSGGAGNDSIYADTSDTVDGGTGFDALYITDGAAPAGLSIDLAATGIEFVIDFTVSGGNDTINGGASSADLQVYTQGGTDNVTGGSGADFLWGGDGNDTITGNNGDDTLVGQDGIDTLTGGAGIDNLYGHTGNGGDGDVDTFVFGDGWGTDFVFDFENGIDRLDVSAVAGLNSFADLAVTNTPEGHAYVRFGGNLIAVAGAATQIDTSDFLF